ncbi:MAG: hypothetical protein K6F89_03815, partial [Prevotella sp.]|nr:hypothetical protein [Prevotella sp.]
MKKLNLLFFGLALIFGMTFVSCSDDDNKGENKPQEQPTETPGNPDDMQFAALSGVVTYSSQYWSGDQPIGGVKVTSGDQTTTTDLNGFYQFDKANVVNGHIIVKFEKDGYNSVVRTVEFEDGVSTRLDASLMEVTPTTPFDAATPMTISAGDSYYGEVQIDLKGGYVNKETGAAYTGKVTASTVYLDPDKNGFAKLMPGDLSAINTNNEAIQLISWGMVSVDLKGSNGEKLQLAAGKPAKVTFPIPDRFKNGDKPQTIPLWSFDEATGVWKQEGNATLNDNVYEGEVTHFSWTNLDTPETTAHLKVTVKDSKGNLLANVPVDVDGMRTFHTKGNGVMKCDVVANTKLKIKIPSSYCGKELVQEIKIDGQKTGELTFTIPGEAPRIYGTVKNTSGSNVCSLYIIFNMMANTIPVMSDVNGAYSLFGPADYTGAATLCARFGDGSIVKKDFTLTKDDQRIDIEVSVPSGAGTGMFHVTNSNCGLDVTYALPAPKEGGLWQAKIDNGELSVSGQKTIEGIDENDPMWEHMRHEGGESFKFSVSGYTEGKQEYDNAEFEFHGGGGPHFGLN